MSTELNKEFFTWRILNGWGAPKEMFNILSHQGTANPCSLLLLRCSYTGQDCVSKDGIAHSWLSHPASIRSLLQAHPQADLTWATSQLRLPPRTGCIKLKLSRTGSRNPLISSYHTPFKGTLTQNSYMRSSLASKALLFWGHSCSWAVVLWCAQATRSPPIPRGLR